MLHWGDSRCFENCGSDRKLLIEIFLRKPFLRTVRRFLVKYICRDFLPQIEYTLPGLSLTVIGMTYTIIQCTAKLVFCASLPPIETYLSGCIRWKYLRCADSHLVPILRVDILQEKTHCLNTARRPSKLDQNHDQNIFLSEVHETFTQRNCISVNVDYENVSSLHKSSNSRNNTAVSATENPTLVVLQNTARCAVFWNVTLKQTDVWSVVLSDRNGRQTDLPWMNAGARYGCVNFIEKIVANCSPFSVVEHFQPTLKGRRTANKTNGDRR